MSKSLLDDVEVFDPPEEPTITSDDDNYPVPGTEEDRPKKLAAKRKTARKASKQPKTGVASGETPDSGGKYGSFQENSVATCCSICHKPLSKPTSIERGMGDVCAGQHKLLPAGVTMEEHRENNTVEELPPGYMKLKDAIAEVRRTRKNHGIGWHRLLEAVGGNRFLRHPLNEHFKGVYYKGTRYLPATCLNHLEDLRRV